MAVTGESTDDSLGSPKAFIKGTLIMRYPGLTWRDAGCYAFGPADDMILSNWVYGLQFYPDEEINPRPVRLGRKGALLISAVADHVEDPKPGAAVDHLLDLVLSFNIRDTGIACGDSTVVISGETFSGRVFSVPVPIQTTNCTCN